jgi:hypothetical protein
LNYWGTAAEQEEWLAFDKGPDFSIAAYDMSTSSQESIENPDSYFAIACSTCNNPIKWYCFEDICPKEVGRLFDDVIQTVILELPTEEEGACSGL